MKLQDKVGVITGGGSGIGREIALKFAQCGGKAVVADRKAEAAEGTIDLIQKEGNFGVSVVSDVTDYVGVREMVKGVLDRFGRIDVLINNAGWDKLGPFMETKPEFWEAVVKLNLMGQVFCSRAVLEHMVERKAGAIVNMASDAGKVGFSGEVIYSAAKGGVIAFTKALAKEMGPFGIRVNGVAPGPIETPMLKIGLEKNAYVADEMMKLKRRTPLGRFGKPEEVADLVLFLASDDARFITGQVVSINGGLIM